jgi:hypothetical protein
LTAANGKEVKVGIVKWMVDIYDASEQSVRDQLGVEGVTGETVGIATILTMVQKKKQQ